jgi:hypothetical protein
MWGRKETDSSDNSLKPCMISHASNRKGVKSQKNGTHNLTEANELAQAGKVLCLGHYNPTAHHIHKVNINYGWGWRGKDATDNSLKPP